MDVEIDKCTLRVCSHARYYWHRWRKPSCDGFVVKAGGGDLVGGGDRYLDHGGKLVLVLPDEGQHACRAIDTEHDGDVSCPGSRRFVEDEQVSHLRCLR